MGEDMRDDGLDGLMQRFERERFGASGVGLQGARYLKSELVWLHQYLQKGEKGGEDVRLGSLDGNDWRAFAHDLYRSSKLQKRDISRVLKVVTTFLSWCREESGEEPGELGFAIEALRLARSEIERLDKISRYLREIENTRVYVPGPTDTSDDFELQEAAHEIVSAEGLEKSGDIFLVRSVRKKQQVVYLRGRESGASIAFRVDRPLARLLKPGDRLPLTLGVREEGSQVLLGSGAPELVEEDP